MSFGQCLQQLEERRVGKVQEYIQKSADIENDAVPIINTCIAAIVSSAKTVDPAEVRFASSASNGYRYYRYVFTSAILFVCLSVCSPDSNSS